MTRILTYNILMGAAKRVDPLVDMISSVQPDIVGLAEAVRPDVVEKLGQRLGMQHIMSGPASHSDYWQVALLSRLPVVYSRTHIRPQTLTKPLLEVCLEEPGGRQITVFVIHMAASFSHGWAGDGIRRREARELLQIMAAKTGTPHVVIGDFNTLAPGEAFEASTLLRYIVEQDERHKQNPAAMEGHPYLDFVVPEPLRIFKPLLRLIARVPLLDILFDGAASLYAPRSSISMLLKAGYVDCFRQMNPGVAGFTCPAGAPAGRIDFIFASPELAASLTSSQTLTSGISVSAEQASDHQPVVAEFGEPVDERDQVNLEQHSEGIHV
jgi:endonuclease/exonuclease/phosphatase family metal-dependent hydrolase